MDNLAEVKEILGTKGTTKTVNAALQRIIDGNRRSELLRDFLDGNRTDLNDPEVMSKAWYRPPEPE